MHTTQTLQAALCRRSLLHFARTFWPLAVPEPLVEPWFYATLAERLQFATQRVAKRQPRLADLLINMPPGTGKSTLLSVMLPAWAWTQDPRIRIITASYSEDLANHHALKTRDILTSPQFQALFPEEALRLRPDKHRVGEVENRAGGCRVAIGAGSTITGKHAHLILIDDPINPRQALGAADRRRTAQWLERTLSQRKADRTVSMTVMLMQRLHAEDPAGRMLARAKSSGAVAVEHLCLPAELSSDVQPQSLATHYADGLLWPARLGREALAEARTELGSVGYAGQMMQRPSPEGGGLVKTEWFGRFQAPSHRDLQKPTIHLAVDPAYTSSDRGDPTGILAFSYSDGEMRLHHAAAVRLEFPELCRALGDLAVRFGLAETGGRLLIEPKASGKSLVQALRRTPGLERVAVMESPAPRSDKIARLTALTPLLEAGKVLLPDAETHASPEIAWIPAFLDELAGFPHAAHDDLADALCIAMQFAFGARKAPIAWV